MGRIAAGIIFRQAREARRLPAGRTSSLKDKTNEDDQLPLFEFEEGGNPVAPRLKRLTTAIWTANKAALIQRYLRYFVFITKHGTYIDGFAGPQRRGAEHMWTARLVLESEPRWLRHFYLFELNSRQVQELERLRKEQSADPRRKVQVIPGDFNLNVLTLLSAGRIRESEATFCLLDQRTFECKWQTVVALAKGKPSSHKIELFYFLPIGWFRRAVAAIRDSTILQEWWGRDDWRMLRDWKPADLVAAVTERFQSELGYRYVAPWPILQRRNSTRVMYSMIHASDHPEAPKLMRRAYERAVEPPETIEQLELELGSGVDTEQP